MNTRSFLHSILERLLSSYGPQNWWPAESPFEVMAGAILTQNTAWTNVEKAIAGLKEVTELTPGEILLLSTEKLQDAIRPSGYYRQKAEKLQNLCRFFVERYNGDFSGMEGLPTNELRKQFLSLYGIGPETADSILLYALRRPVFVVDAYTIRLCSRLGLTDGNGKYNDVQGLFIKHLQHDSKLFSEYHALIVKHCKESCRKTHPQCKKCPLMEWCVYNLKFQFSDLTIPKAQS